MEGHDVDAWVKEPRFRRASMGIINRTRDWRPSLRRADLVVTDMVGSGKLAAEFRDSETPFIGANEYVDRVELDRALGMEMFQRAGVAIPETLSFASPRQVRLPTPWNLGWVIKPCGNVSTAKTMMVSEAANWEHCLGKCPEGPLIVQRIVKGIEVSTEGWFNGKQFLRPFNHTFEEKRFMPGNLGVTTGCMGNVVCATDSNRLTRATVEKLGSFLRMVGYRGPFDVNCIVTKDAALALEATGRMGYDAVEALAELLDEPFGSFLFGVAKGSATPMALGGDYAIAVRLSVPPWPIQKPDETGPAEPILGLTPENLEHVFLTDVFKKDGKYWTANGDGVLLKATSRSPRISSAQQKVYATLEQINVSGKQYRNDIGGRVASELQQLEEWGWL